MARFQRNHRHLTEDETIQVRRLMLVVLSGFGVDAGLLGSVFRMAPRTVRSEVRQGYPLDLDPEHAQGIIEGLREVIGDIRPTSGRV